MDERFYAINTELAHRSDLTGDAKILFAELLSLTQGKGYSWATNAFLAKEYGVTTRTVCRWISELKDKGLITVKIIDSQRRISVSAGKNPLEGTTKLSQGYDKNVTGGTTDMSQGYDKIVTGGTTELSQGYDKNVTGGTTELSQGYDKIVTGGTTELSQGYDKNVTGGTTELSQGYDKNVTGGTTELSHRIDNRIDNRIDKENKRESNSKYYNSVIEKYNSVCKELPEVRKLTDGRKKAIFGFVREFGKEALDELFDKAGKSKFLSGRNDRNWVADFDWLLKTENAVKVLEDRYSDGRDRAAEEAAERRRRAYEETKRSNEKAMEEMEELKKLMGIRE